MERYALLTMSELAETLVSNLDLHDIRRIMFLDCDFAVADYCEDDSLEEIRHNSTGWYGVKSIDTGFDSDELCLVADYYGGGCAHFLTLEDDLFEKTATHCIAHLIMDTLSVQESVRYHTKLIVDFEPEGRK